MKLTSVIALLLATTAGWFAARLTQRPQAAGDVARHILYYQSPMHPWVKADKPGHCTVCGMDLVPIYEGGRNFDKDSADVVMLPQGSPNIVGVQTAPVKKGPVIRTLHVAGMIGEDESRHGIISAPVEGRLDGLAMNCDGQPITRRQPIGTIFSRTLLAAAEDYKTAIEPGGPALEKAKRQLERYGQVWEQIKTIPQRQPDDIYFGILAPLSGTIVKSYVAEGQYVKEGEKLFEIADFTTMWFMFTAYEQDLPFIRQGQIISIQAPSMPGKVIKARVSFISPNMDEMTRSARVRVVVENPDRSIKNKTFAEGMLETTLPDVLAIPRTAVLWPGDAPRVYVEKQPGNYEQRSVKLGRAGDSTWEVLDGLTEGEHVVTRGNMLIDGQAQLTSLTTASH